MFWDDLGAITTGRCYGFIHQRPCNGKMIYITRNALNHWSSKKQEFELIVSYVKPEAPNNVYCIIPGKYYNAKSFLYKEEVDFVFDHWYAIFPEKLIEIEIEMANNLSLRNSGSTMRRIEI